MPAIGEKKGTMVELWPWTYPEMECLEPLPERVGAELENASALFRVPNVLGDCGFRT